jgi:signal transduction histidine kinase
VDQPSTHIRTVPGDHDAAGMPTTAPVTPVAAVPRETDHAAAAPETGTPLFGNLAPLVTVLRWITLTVAVILASIGDRPGAGLIVGFVLVGIDTVARTFRPVDISLTDRRAEVEIFTDLAIATVAISMSGRWESPLVLTLVPTVLLAGAGWGYVRGIAAGAATGTAIAAADLAIGLPANALRNGLQGGLVLLLTAAIGGFTRRLQRDAEVRERQAIDEFSRMATANDLLLALHNVAQTLPASLDLGEVVASTRSRLRELFDYTTAAILVFDESTASWRVELAEGTRLGSNLSSDSLPSALRDADHSSGVLLIADLLRNNRVGCSPLSRSALVAPLHARGNLVGVVSIEHTLANHFTETDRGLLTDFTEPLALAVDNALWFSKLRTLGAEAERARIARDLHDRLAQSLAYVAFELERLAKLQDGSRELLDLHDIVRGVVGELRETLYQLRINVTDGAQLADVVLDYVERFEARTGIAVSLIEALPDRNLPVPVEQELWRILQEALTNVERHSDARRAWIRWTVEHDHASLEVRDDGRGFRPQGVTRERFGLVGMGERADAIGAHLTIDSAPGCGTRVLVELEVPR